MLFQIVCFFIIPMLIDMLLMLRPVKLLPFVKKKKLRYSIRQENGAKKSGSILISAVDKGRHYQISHHSQAYLYFSDSDRTVYCSDIDTVKLSRRAFTLSDSGERIRLKGHGFVLTKFCIIAVLAVRFLILPLTFQTCIKPFADNMVAVSAVSLNHTFSSEAIQDDSVYNVLIIGTDGRFSETAKADVLMLLSLNHEYRRIRLVSIQRDLYVEAHNPNITTFHEMKLSKDDPNYEVFKASMPDSEWTNRKLGETAMIQDPACLEGKTFADDEEKENALFMSGISSLVDTIEYNCGFCIDDVVTVDFSAARAVIDALGGADVHITKEYADSINGAGDEIGVIAEQNLLFGTDDRIEYTEDKVYHLNGNECLAYLRMRYVGNGSDVERGQRQREFLSSLLSQKKALLYQPYALDLDTLYTAAESMQTTMTEDEMYEILDILVNDYYTLDFDCTLPIEGHWTDQIILYKDGTEVTYTVIPAGTIDIKEQAKMLLYGTE